MPPKVPDVITCNSATFAYELEGITETLSKPETEDTWDALGRAIQRWTALLKGGAPAEDHIAGLRSQSRVVIRCLNSERTILSGHAITLLEQTAVRLGAEFDSICSLFVPVLLGLCARTVKLYVTRARACLLTIVDEAHPPAMISHLRHSMDTKSTSLRLTATEITLACLNSMNPADLAKEARAKDIESVIRAAIGDANSDVRKIGRKAYEAYATVLPNRVFEFVRPLTPTTRKYLGLKSSESSSRPTSRPQSAMSRPASRTEPQAGHQNVLPTRPAPRPRIVSTNETRKRDEGARSPPLANPSTQSDPPHSAPVVHTLARRVPDIVAATGDNDTHVRSNSLRGGAFNSGAASKDVNVRGPARVAHAEAPKPVPKVVETSEVKTKKPPVLPPAPARPQIDSSLKSTDNTTSSSQLNRASNSKSSGPIRAAAAGPSRPLGRVPIQRSTSIQASSSGALKADSVGKALSRSTSATLSIDLASSTTSNSSTTAKRAIPAMKPAAPPSEALAAKRADVAKPASTTSRAMGPPAQIPKRPVVSSSSSSTAAPAAKSGSRDLTRPTASQMARMQSAQTTAKVAPKEPKSKPAWGRPQAGSTKPVPPTSRANATANKREVPPSKPRTGNAPAVGAAKTKAKLATKEVKKAAAVPLPPSPKVEPVTAPELSGETAAELEPLDQDSTSETVIPAPPAATLGEVTPEQAMPPAPYPEMSIVGLEDGSDDSSSDGENENEVEEAQEEAEAEALLPVEEPILHLSDEEDDLADLQADEEHEDVHDQGLPQIMPFHVDEEPVHQRSDTESEDMQMTAVVDHDRHLTGESDYTLRIPDSFILDGPDSPPKPNILPVPATPISTLLSSIQNGFLPSAAHPSLLPSPDAAEYGNLHPHAHVLPPAFPLSLTSNLKRTAAQTNEGTILFGAKAMIATDEPLERGVLTEKQM